MFPSLKSLFLQNNGLVAAADGLPASLPAEWTQLKIPRAFPKLHTLVLYPGNDNLCFLPDGAQGGVGYVEVNGGTWWDVVRCGAVRLGSVRV